MIENTRCHRELREPSLVQPKIAISILDQRGRSLFLRPKASTSTLSHGHKLSHGPSRFLLEGLANPLSASVLSWQHCVGAIVVR